MAVPFVADAAFGLNILKAVFGQGQDESICYDDLLENNEPVSKEFNDRVPSILKKGKLSRKMFTQGWKFDMFNI